MKKIFAGVALAGVVLLSGCKTDADIASQNLSKAADMFEIDRRIVFYNGITGEYMLSIEGKCSIGTGNSTKSVTVTCKTSPTEYKKHFLGLSDNVTFFAEQLKHSKVSTFHNRVIFKPQSILPDIDMRYDTEQAIEAITPDNKDN